MSDAFTAVITKGRTLVEHLRRSDRGIEEDAPPDILKETYAKRDAKSNERSRLPEGEKIELHSIWIVECFPPSHIDSLIQSIRDQEWVSQLRPSLSPIGSLDQWIEQQRWSANAGSVNYVKTIAREDDEHSWFDTICATIPENAVYAKPWVHHAVPGLFLVVIQVILQPQPSDAINTALRKEFRTRFVSHEGGWTAIESINLRQEAVDQIRREARHACLRWLSETLPGVFAQAGSLAAYPTCDVLSLAQGEPADHQQWGQWGNYLTALRLGRDFNSWQGKQLPGMRLQVPYSEEEELSLALSANRSAVSGEMNRHMNGERLPRVFVNPLSEFHWIMSRWSLHALLHLYERDYAAMRDKAAYALAQTSLENATDAVESLERSLLRISGDALAVASELSRLCAEKPFFHNSIPEFRRIFPQMEATHVREDELPEIVDRLGRPMRSTRMPLIDADPALFEQLRVVMNARCDWLTKTELLVRQLIQAASSVISTRSQMELSRTHTRLQRWVIALTVALTGLTVALLVLAALQFFALR